MYLRIVQRDRTVWSMAIDPTDEITDEQVRMVEGIASRLLADRRLEIGYYNLDLVRRFPETRRPADFFDSLTLCV